MLADADRAVYQHYGLGKALLVIQHSGTLLVDEHGVLRYIHAGANPNDALNRAELRAAVQALGPVPAGMG